MSGVSGSTHGGFDARYFGVIEADDSLNAFPPALEPARQIVCREWAKGATMSPDPVTRGTIIERRVPVRRLMMIAGSVISRADGVLISTFTAGPENCGLPYGYPYRLKDQQTVVPVETDIQRAIACDSKIIEVMMYFIHRSLMMIHVVLHISMFW